MAMPGIVHPYSDKYFVIVTKGKQCKVLQVYSFCQATWGLTRRHREISHTSLPRGKRAGRLREFVWAAIKIRCRSSGLS